VALLHFSDQFGLLTINFKGELYFARRMEIGFSQLAGADERGRDELFNRVLLELQRTLDHFDRQFPFVAVSKLMYGPEPRSSGLFEYLAANVDIPMERVQLRNAIQFSSDAAPESATEWQLFHHIGASLRHESKVL
jgi:MSHA biogenesis protein MshI